MDDWFEFDHLRQSTILRGELSDLIVVPTPVLLEKVERILPGKKVVVLEEPIDIDRILPFDDLLTKQRKTPIVVWTGNPGNLKLLQQIGNLLGQLCKIADFKLRVISKTPPDFSFNCNWEWKKYDYQNESKLMEGAVAGIVPINDTPHDRAKGVYKAKTYLAAGIPVVGPPLGYLNNIVVSNENGFLCASESEWIECLSKLIKNPSERIRISKKARHSAERKFSHDAVSYQWVNSIKANFSTE
jgi:glycosyltransferase involved in cell wall biosynthesis